MGTFRVGEWEVQPQLNTISTDGKTIRIEPKVMEVLLCLIEHKNEVVAKDCLMETVWAERFVTEEVLTNSIWALRRAFGDQAKNPSFIQTIPKKGYRLIAPVSNGAAIQSNSREAVSHGSAAFPGPENNGQMIGFYSIKRTGKVIFGILAVGLIAFVFAKLWQVSSIKAKPGDPQVSRDGIQKGTHPATTQFINDAANESYEKGLQFQTQMTEKGLKQSLEEFASAIQADPDYAPAYAGLANSYDLLESQGYLTSEETYPKARELATKALQLDTRLAEAHAALAFVKWRYDLDWAGSETEFKQALALNPDYVFATIWYSGYLSSAGRLDEALVVAKRAQELSPSAPGIKIHAGNLFLYARRFDEAVLEFEKALNIDPNAALAYKGLGRAYEGKAMMKEAEGAYQKALELTEKSTSEKIAREIARGDQKSDAHGLRDRLAIQLRQRFVRPTYVARIFAESGDKDRAFEWLEVAYAERDSELPFLRFGPGWETLREDPRFASLLRRIGPVH